MSTAETASSAATVTATPNAAVPVSQGSAPAPVAAGTPAPAAAPAKAAEKASWLAAAEGVKPVAEPAKPEAAKQPEKFDLKVPEGHTMEAAALEAFEARMKALGVSQEQAQKLLSEDLEAQKKTHADLVAQLDKQDADWLGELKSEWGAKFAENGEKLKRVYDYIDPQGDLRKGLEAMKLAHNPVLNKALAKLIPLFEEPKLKPPSAAGVVEKDTRTASEKLAAQFRAELEKAPVIPPGMKFTT